MYCQIFKYQFQAVNDGQSAVNAVKNNDFDLILMDIGMPFLDGYGATEKIREIDKEKGRHTIIVGQTAFASSLESEEADKLYFEAGMDAIMSKPYNQDLLESFLASILFLK